MGIERSTGSAPELGTRHNVPEEPGTFYGHNVSGMSSRTQVIIGLGVLLPTLLALGSIPFFIPFLEPEERSLGPAIFIFLFFSSLGWTVPAAALMMRGIAELRDSRSSGSRSPVSGARASRAALETSGAGERAILKALRGNGEMSAARAAAEASITAAEADEILSRLAGEGHLRLRIRGVGLFYSLWETRVEDGGSGEFGAL